MVTADWVPSLVPNRPSSASPCTLTTGATRSSNVVPMPPDRWSRRVVQQPGQQAARQGHLDPHLRLDQLDEQLAPPVVDGREADVALLEGAPDRRGQEGRVAGVGAELALPGEVADQGAASLGLLGLDELHLAAVVDGAGGDRGEHRERQQVAEQPRLEAPPAAQAALGLQRAREGGVSALPERLLVLTERPGRRADGVHASRRRSAARW